MSDKDLALIVSWMTVLLMYGYGDLMIAHRKKKR